MKKAFLVKYWLFFLITMFISDAARSETINRPFLFSIKKDGQVSFLFGTLHGGVSSHDLPDFVFEAIQSRELFLEEIVYDSSQNIPADISRQLPSPKPETEEILKARGIPEYLYICPCICDAYYIWEFEDHDYFMDRELDQYAKANSKKRVGLDDATAIAKMNQNFSTGTSSCKIDEIVDAKQSIEFKLSNLNFIATYRAGDTDKISPLTGFDADRTLEWLPEIEDAHAKGAFVSVGAGHLVGNNGLLSLLSEKGFAVRPIESLSDLKNLLYSQ